MRPHRLHLVAACARLLVAEAYALRPYGGRAGLRVASRGASAARDEVDLDEVLEAEEGCLSIKFVTGNAMKLREVEAILSQNGLPLPLEQCDIDLDEYQGEAEDIAAAKCRLAAEATGSPALIDDTSLCLEALGGMPGPYIKWFSDVDLPRVLRAYDNKRAYAQSCIAFSLGPGSVPLVFTGRVFGDIVDPRGESGFGWDACFKPDGSDVTFAEMDAATKNLISHRSRALEQLSTYLKGDADLLVSLCAEYVSDPQEPEDRFFFHRRRKEV